MNKTIVCTIALAMLFIGIAACCADPSDAASDYDARSSVQFDGNGGSGTVPTQKVLSGNTIQLPASGYSRNGYYLSGWLEGSSNGMHVDLGSAYSVSDDIVMFAEWTHVPDYFDSRAPSSVVSGCAYGYTPYNDVDDTNERPVWLEFAVNFMYYSQDPLYDCTIVRDSVPDWIVIAVSDGYIPTFAGTCHVPGLYAVNIHLNIDGPAGFEKNYAVAWVVSVLPEHQGEILDLVFDPNGGDGHIATMNAQYANGIVLPSEGVSRDGYTLVGWMISVDGTEATFPLGSVYTMRSDTTAKAHW
ncbi:MAG: InlB B-repeat-containing protein, partial [Candidatus Methanomethylophilaceae archaeon]